MESALEFKQRVLEFVGGGESVFRKSAMRIRDGAGVFAQVLGDGNYRTVLEIGTYRGISTAYLAQFCQRVITLDLVNGKLELEPKDRRFNRRDFWKYMGVDDKIDLHLVADNHEKARLIKLLSGRPGFDFAFIDGGKWDIAQDFQSVKCCGTVLFHDYDYHYDAPSKNHVYNFVNSLPSEQITVMDIFALWQEP